MERALQLKNYQAELINLRSHRRFVIQDKRLWQLKIQDKKFPLDWVHNMSRSGLQVRQGRYRGFLLNEVLNIELRFLGSTILQVKGQVKWIQRDQEHLNMNVLGVEFLQESGQPIKKWVKKPMFKNQAIVSCDQVRNEELLKEIEKSKRARFQLSELQWVLAVVLPFAAGYVAGFFQ